ncbi:hypothetical protein SAMN05421890_0273 [Ensifer adhaerens]|nr:hypothetical protein SAMN05421890_0273 [Ensifer adhaerens]
MSPELVREVNMTQTPNGDADRADAAEIVSLINQLVEEMGEAKASSEIDVLALKLQELLDTRQANDAGCSRS